MEVNELKERKSSRFLYTETPTVVGKRSHRVQIIITLKCQLDA